MGKTIVYALGMLALAFTDFSHPDAFYRLVLPLFDLLFIIFLGFELVFYFSVLGFSESEYNAFNLCRDLFTLRDDIADLGIVPAIFGLLLALADFLLLFVALIYSLSRILDLVMM